MHVLILQVGNVNKTRKKVYIYVFVIFTSHAAVSVYAIMKFTVNKCCIK